MAKRPLEGRDDDGGPLPSPPPRTWLKTLRRHLQWALVLAVGVVVGTVLFASLALKLALQFLWSPRSVLLRRPDRSQLHLPDPLPGLAHHFVETEPGIRLHVARTSPPATSRLPLLLLVHGFPEAWFSWRHQMAALRGDFQVVAVDMRGYNLSSAPQGRDAYRMERLVGDLVALAEHLLQEEGQQQLALVGHDWGGNVCWAAAHYAPHLFSRLAVLCAPHPRCFLPNLDWDQFKRSWYMVAFQVPWVPELAFAASDYELLRDILQRPPSGALTPGAITPEDLERYKQALSRPGALTAAINYYRAMLDSATRRPSAQINRSLRRQLEVPTLLLWAERDSALGQKLLRGTERHVRDLRIEVLPGCSHWAQQDQPAEVTRRLRAFLGGGEKGGGGGGGGGAGIERRRNARNS